ncbi:TMEM175 family protein [Fulvimonas sp. R45]|uniref:TMEM175 family protein n=1 Tax=Fulvimonas sp. R45 TaxID=3045937 RepID=UPI00265E4E83|nr:TMEM175 family protein [Fulvimonas sp. R45]MDO1528412.1 TMEM175 family protein [Fulvimonas sp. R45]
MEQNVTPHVREHHVHQRHFDRLVMLSDGVFAIAMTLSAVELRPEAKPGQTLLQIWGLPLLAYFLTFFILVTVWLQHRRSLAQLRRTDHTLTLITMVLLSLVALMPVLIRAMVTTESGLAPGVGLTVYAFALLLVNVCLTAGWGYAAFIGGLVPDMPRPKAWGWLLHDVFATLTWAAIGCWLLHLVWAAVLAGALALAARIASARLARQETAAAG